MQLMVGLEEAIKGGILKTHVDISRHQEVETAPTLQEHYLEEIMLLPKRLQVLVWMNV